MRFYPSFDNHHPCLDGGGTALRSQVYNLLPIDLRLPPSTTLATTLPTLLSPTLPTLLLFECVLVYLTPTTSDGLLQWFVDYFSAPSTEEPRTGVLGAVVYEMFGLGDSFGRVMLNNLKVLSIHHQWYWYRFWLTLRTIGSQCFASRSGAVSRCCIAPAALPTTEIYRCSSAHATRHSALVHIQIRA